ncbi:hypothetical protein PHISCL_03975 [Aspergillus sclerotialis]|uniref:Uncharacterized protein n=1 Tax=Aspergillus sclerotialis TaxID=2070753 RepID=A0A3A2ZM70_9EURO|nr:hypothetical protein PHISCL_03975 [Aspergillus sclerotialis]
MGDCPDPQIPCHHDDTTAESGEQLSIPESLFPRPDSPSAASRFTHVPRPLHTDMLIVSSPCPDYIQVVNELNQISLDGENFMLRCSIHRLLALHAASDNCFVVNAHLERLCPQRLIQKMVALEELFTHCALTQQLDDNIRDLLDMCNFLYYAPLIKRDIEQLLDGPQKDFLKRLYHSTCPGGHTKE